MSQWSHIMSNEELEARNKLCASLDARFERSQREHYESRTEAQLRVMAVGAWHANDADTYQLARTYLRKNFNQIYPQ